MVVAHRCEARRRTSSWPSLMKYDAPNAKDSLHAKSDARPAGAIRFIVARQAAAGGRQGVRSFLLRELSATLYIEPNK